MGDGAMEEMTLRQLLESLPRRDGADEPTHRAWVEYQALVSERDEARRVIVELHRPKGSHPDLPLREQPAGWALEYAAALVRELGEGVDGG